MAVYIVISVVIQSQSLPVANDEPDIRILAKFPCSSGDINIIEEATSKYRTLGNILLNSPNGTAVQRFEQMHSDPCDIVHDIFRAWLTRDETATWKKLVQCLRHAELNPLAKKIEDRLH